MLTEYIRHVHSLLLLEAFCRFITITDVPYRICFIIFELGQEPFLDSGLKFLE